MDCSLIAASARLYVAKQSPVARLGPATPAPAVHGQAAMQATLAGWVWYPSSSSHTACHHPVGHAGSHRAMSISLQLLPESPREQTRHTRQVSHCWWAIARRTRRISRRLQAQATQLLRDSQALGECQHRQRQGRTPTRPA